VPEADAKVQAGTVAVGNASARGDQIVTQIFRLQHENANNMVPVLRPLISPNNTINANPNNNTLVITDYADNLQRLGKIIASMDMPSSTELEMIPVRHAVAADIAPMVQKMADAQGNTGVPAGVVGGGGGATTVIADPRTNTLLVKAANPSKLAIIKSTIAKLDVPGTGGVGGSNIYVVYLKHADSVKLAQVLRAAYPTTGKDGNVTVGAGGAGGANSALNAQQNLGGGANAASGGLSAQATAPVTQSGGPSTGGFIQADPATNSLIITAPEPMYRQLRAVIEQLDSRRAQVYVESLIVEVNADKAADVGFQWQGILGQKGDDTLYGAGTNFRSGGNNIVNLSAATASSSGVRAGLGELLSTAGSAATGFNFGVLKNIGGVYTVGALAQFLQSNADGNVLSTPTLMTLDNEEAKIVVGQNVPFVTGQFTNTGAANGSVNPFQTIERKDVGLTLRIKPQIGENGTVKLNIFQESSSVADNSSSGLITRKRSIESQVIVDDGAMLAIGGLMEDSYTGSNSKVPGLGDVPVLGGLFRSESRSRKKTNLMVFLRPVVVRSAEDTNKLSMDRYDMIRATQQKHQPEQRLLLPINEAPVLPPSVAPMGLPASGPVPNRPVGPREPVGGYLLPEIK
jgi:general secretion pathway protein D